MANERIDWRKAAASTANGGACVELGRIQGTGVVAIRNSRDPEGAQLRFNAGAVQELIHDAQEGKLDWLLN
jgi:hypothetical protein